MKTSSLVALSLVAARAGFAKRAYDQQEAFAAGQTEAVDPSIMTGYKSISPTDQYMNDQRWQNYQKQQGAGLPPPTAGQQYQAGQTQQNFRATQGASGHPVSTPPVSLPPPLPAPTPPPVAPPPPVK